MNTNRPMAIRLMAIGLVMSVTWVCDKTKVQWRELKTTLSVDTQSACSLTSLPVMMIKKDQQHTVGECMFCVGGFSL